MDNRSIRDPVHILSIYKDAAILCVQTLWSVLTSVYLFLCANLVDGILCSWSWETSGVTKPVAWRFSNTNLPSWFVYPTAMSAPVIAPVWLNPKAK